MAFEERVEAAARWYDRGMQDLDSSISRLATVFDSKVVFDSPLSNEELVLHDVVHLVVGGWTLSNDYTVTVPSTSGLHTLWPRHRHELLVMTVDCMMSTLDDEAADVNEVTTMAVELELLRRHGLLVDYFRRPQLDAGSMSFWTTVRTLNWRALNADEATMQIEQHIIERTHVNHICDRVELYIDELVEQFCVA